MKSPQELLQHYWGYDQFRSNQLPAINAILSGNDTLLLMPTSGGKSICYQIPALAREGICIVISPLIALMEDQVNQLNEKGIKAMTLPGGTSFSELDILLNNCIYGNYKFLYISPERLQQEIVRERIQKMNVNLFAVDEAHCISQWGHDFRPSYLDLKILKELHSAVPIIAVTATATEKVQQDIVEQLQFKEFKLFRSSYKRDNLSYGVYKTQDKNFLLQQILLKRKGSSIVYVPTRNATIKIAEFLENQNITSLPYHGGLDSKTKKDHFKQWMENNAQVMVATNAFGMGIDKPDVRTVIHLHVPQSMEAYFQEAGRAGRDGKRAYALLLQTANSIDKLKNQYESQTPDLSFIKKVYRKLSSYLQIGYGEGNQNTYPLVFSEFCERYQFLKGKVYTSLKILDKNGIISFNEVFSRNCQLQIIVSVAVLNQFINITPLYQPICGVISRLYPGVFTNPVAIDPGVIAQHLKISQDEVTNQLQKLNEQGLVEFQNEVYDSLITYLQPREDDLAVNTSKKNIKIHLKNRLRKIKEVIAYVKNDKVCKSKQLLEYFGEAAEDCGICSVCLKRNKLSGISESVKQEILQFLRNKPQNSRAIVAHFAYAEEDIICNLRDLLQDGQVKIQGDNTYIIIE